MPPTATAALLACMLTTTPASRWTAYETSRDGKAPLAPPATAGAGGGPEIAVDPGEGFQGILGFGGALTESSAWVLAQLPPARRLEVLRRYFDPADGLGYTLARTHVNSCDFSLHMWELDPVPGDYDLHGFSLEPMRRWLLPLLHDAQAAAGGAGKLRLLASPWSPPSWMKTNGTMDRGGKLRPEYAPSWAGYYVRFVEEMEKEGLPVWALTVQNEPEAAQRWESCEYTPEEERDFVRDHLGPALERAGLARVKLLGWDHNRDRLEARAAAMLGDPATARYLWGLGVHWYVSDDFAASARVHAAHPTKHLLFTEGTVEGARIGLWENAERYAHQIMGDLSNFVEGWIRLERGARPAGRAEPRRQLLRRAGHRRHAHEGGPLRPVLPRHRPLLPVREAGRAADRLARGGGRAGGHRLPEPGRRGRDRAPQRDRPGRRLHAARRRGGAAGADPGPRHPDPPPPAVTLPVKAASMRLAPWLIAALAAPLLAAGAPPSDDRSGLSRYRAANARLGPPRPDEQRVVLLGDSIVEDWPVRGAALFRGRPWIGRGIAGQTTAQLLLRFRQDVVELRPAAVVVLGGTNDVAGNDGPYREEETVANVTAMIELARQSRIQVVLAAVLPAASYPWRPGGDPPARIRALNARLQALAAATGAGWADLHGPLADARGGLPPALSEDGVHPNAAGYARMNPIVERAVREALGVKAASQPGGAP
ncbi:MAG: GDSL-type esterase/lipase family protein [Anaeromyxobacteraceae bacterium]